MGMLAQAKELSRVQQRSSIDPQFSAILEIIKTAIVYKFPKLSRGAIEQMLGLSELKQTRVYQDALQEGEQTGLLKGKLEEAQSLILCQLTHRLGNVNLELRSQIQSLSLTQLESLGWALLDFSEPADLVKWLGKNQP
jgi:predicted transposase YdaD